MTETTTQPQQILLFDVDDPTTETISREQEFDGLRPTDLETIEKNQREAERKASLITSRWEEVKDVDCPLKMLNTKHSLRNSVKYIRENISAMQVAIIAMKNARTETVYLRCAREYQRLARLTDKRRRETRAILEKYADHIQNLTLA